MKRPTRREPSVPELVPMQDVPSDVVPAARFSEVQRICFYAEPLRFLNIGGTFEKLKYT